MKKGTPLTRILSHQGRGVKGNLKGRVCVPMNFHRKYTPLAPPCSDRMKETRIVPAGFYKPKRGDSFGTYRGDCAL